MRYIPVGSGDNTRAMSLMDIDGKLVDEWGRVVNPSVTYACEYDAINAKQRETCANSPILGTKRRSKRVKRP